LALQEPRDQQDLQESVPPDPLDQQDLKASRLQVKPDLQDPWVQQDQQGQLVSELQDQQDLQDPLEDLELQDRLDLRARPELQA